MANEIQITVVEEPPQQQPKWAPAPLVPITTHAEYVIVAEGLKTNKTYQDNVNAFFDPHISRAHKAHQALIADKKKALQVAVVDEAERKRLMVAWDDAQQRIADEQQRAAQAAADQAALDQKRVEEDAAQAEALRLAAAGRLLEAEAVLSEQIAAPPPEPVYVPPVQRSTPKVGGISLSERPCFEVVDVAKLPKEYIKADEVKIGAVVRTQGLATRIAGVRVWMEKGISARKA